MVEESVFRAAAWAGLSETPPLMGRDRHDLHFPDPVEWVATEARMAEAGFALRPYVELVEQPLTRFLVSDQSGAPEALDNELLTVLGMSQPTFRAASASIGGRAELEGVDEPIELWSSSARDPERFATPPLSGGWLRAEGGYDQVVLPRSVLGGEGDSEPEPGSAASSVSEDSFADVLGRAVHLVFERRVPSGTERLSIPVEVVGVAELDGARVPLELMARIQAWEQNRVVYNQAQGVFESPAEVALRNGWVRANLFAADVASVRPLVEELRAMGYHTEDRLAQQDNLRRLGRILVFVVGFFVLGCVLNASITVLVATMMNVKSKIFEIGILRAHGVRAKEVVGIFASQGLAIGAVSFLCACALVALGEPWLRDGVRQVFGLDSGGLLAGSPFDGSLWWLSATALAISVLFSFGGVVLPAFFACRLAPVEALRRRE